MLVLLSVGISDYLSNRLSKLPKTVSDAKDIYKLFSQLSGTNFSHEKSISQVNISSIQFITLLDSICSSLNEDDIFILYFSGHGSLTNNELYLYFEDASSNNQFRGTISFSSMKQILCNIGNSVICIFDCCHSGASVKGSISPDALNKSNLSIIASSSAYSSTPSSEDEKSNSPFTSQLITYIRSIYNSSGKVTIADLAKHFNGSNHMDSMLQPQEGVGNTTLLESTINVINNPNLDFPKQFFSKLKVSNIRTREMLWYSLKDIPNNILTQIFKIWFEENFFEPSWLVRRAVGSILANKISDDNGFYHIIIKFLESKHWSDHCIGIIGARFLIKEKIQIEKKIKDFFFGTHRMDVVWLAHLYLTDSKKITIEDSIFTKLKNSLWGLTDIWDRYGSSDPKSEIAKNLIQHSEELNCVQQFDLHIKLTCGIVPELNEIQSSDHDFLSFLNFIYTKPKRNKIIDQNIKWLLSIIYGEWRGQLDLSLENYFSSLSRCQIKNILNKTNSIPSVECRMAIFQYLSRTPELANYLIDIQWINTECHPWVKREAIDTLFKYNKQNIINNDITLADNSIYPGNTDLILSYITSGLMSNDNLKKISEPLTTIESELLFTLNKKNN